MPVIRALISPAYGPEGRLQIAIGASLALETIEDTRGSLHSNRSYFKGLQIILISIYHLPLFDPSTEMQIARSFPDRKGWRKKNSIKSKPRQERNITLHPLRCIVSYISRSVSIAMIKHIWYFVTSSKQYKVYFAYWNRCVTFEMKFI